VFALKLFGGVSLEGPKGPVTGRAVQRHQLAVLALLAVTRNGRSRDKLTAYLWPEASPERARHVLSQSVYLLRQALGESAISGNREVLRLHDEVVSCDVRTLDCAQAAGDPRGVVAAYTGPFLDSFSLGSTAEFERWADEQRERYAHAYARALGALAEESEGAGDHGGAAHWWRLLAAHDPYSSRTALRLMEALAASGDRAGALQHARVHQLLLRGELELEPDPDVVSVAERLRREGNCERGKVDAAPTAARRETAAGSGRLPVTGTTATPGDTPAAAAVPWAPAPRRQRRSMTGRWRVAAALALALTLVLVIGAQVSRRTPPHTPGNGALPAIRSLAVLPLANLSGDSDKEFFSDGMTAALITELARAGDLRLIARSSVLRYRDGVMAMHEIGDELGVDAVLEGSVIWEGERVTIRVHLAEAATGTHLWGESYERDIREVLKLQQEVARDVAREIRAVLRPAGAPDAHAARAIDPLAYEQFLRGRFHRVQLNDADTRRSIEFLENAIAIDPGFAAAYGELALSYVYLYGFYESERQFLERAILAADRALSLEPEQMEARIARGRILFTPAQGWPLERAASEHERVISRYPNSEEARFQLGQVYFHMGLLEESIDQSGQAAAINPVDLRPRSAMAMALLYQQRAEESLAIWRTLPDGYNAPTRAPHLAWALLLLGRDSEAEAVLEQAVARVPQDRAGTITSMQAVLAAAAGDTLRALEKIDIAQAKERRSILFHHTSYHIGKAYALLGWRDEAIRWLQGAAEDGFPVYTLFARDPHLDSVRGDPRFAALLGELRRQETQYRPRPALPSVAAPRE
jgi:TolB-like protein/DNA-binding SARP family transcriptional activator